jgi:ABC-type lipopolysaccharide export system ATPase subunit
MIQDTTIEFTYAELNALSKLLGSVKFEQDMSASQLQHFATSPLISSAYFKIRGSVLSRSEELTPLVASGPPRDSMDEPWSMVDPQRIEGIRRRLTMLSEREKVFIREMDQRSKDSYSLGLLHPFRGNDAVMMSLRRALEDL